MCLVAGKVVRKTDLGVSGEEGFPGLIWCGWRNAQSPRGILLAMVTDTISLRAQGLPASAAELLLVA